MTSIKGGVSKGTGYQTNICERCSGPLRASDGHFHTGLDSRQLPVEVCCSCSGHEAKEVTVDGKKQEEQAPEVEPKLSEEPEVEEQAPVEEPGTDEAKVYALARLMPKFKIIDLARKAHLPGVRVRNIFHSDERYERLSKQLWRLK